VEFHRIHRNPARMVESRWNGGIPWNPPESRWNYLDSSGKLIDSSLFYTIIHQENKPIITLYNIYNNTINIYIRHLFNTFISKFNLKIDYTFI
jgi:hypothetical protein